MCCYMSLFSCIFPMFVPNPRVREYGSRQSHYYHFPLCRTSMIKLSLVANIDADCAVTIFNTLRPRQNGRHFADDIFKRIFLNENIWIPITISLKFVPKGSINNMSALVQIMAWRRPGDKPLSEPMMANLPTHICVTRPQWVKNPLKYTLLQVWIRNHNCLFTTSKLS